MLKGLLFCFVSLYFIFITFYVLRKAFMQVKYFTFQFFVYIELLLYTYVMNFFFVIMHMSFLY